MLFWKAERSKSLFEQSGAVSASPRIPWSMSGARGPLSGNGAGQRNRLE